jgi:hypothetical protein
MSRLLKSCATPPVSWPIASMRCDSRSACSAFSRRADSRRHSRVTACSARAVRRAIHDAAPSASMAATAKPSGTRALLTHSRSMRVKGCAAARKIG